MNVKIIKSRYPPFDEQTISYKIEDFLGEVCIKSGKVKDNKRVKEHALQIDGTDI